NPGRTPTGRHLITQSDVCYTLSYLPLTGGGKGTSGIHLGLRAQQEEEPHEVLHLHRAGRADRRGPARARRPVHPSRGRRPRRRRRHRLAAVPGRRGRQPGPRGRRRRDQQLVDAVRRRNRDRGRLTHTSMTAGHSPHGRAGVLPPALPVLLERPEGESMSQTNPRKITYADLDRLSGEVLPGRLLLSAV